MIRLEEKYEQAVHFRKRGFTYSEIAKIVGVSKATVSNWLSKKAFSKKIKNDNLKRAAKDNVKRIGLINKARAIERNTRYKEALHAAKTEYKHFAKDPLFTAGLIAYRCCGDLTEGRPIRITSPDPFVHKLFLSFTRSFLGAEKNSMHIWLLLYSDLDEKKCMKYWSANTKLSVSQFYKTQFIQQKAVNPSLQHGTGNTIIGNTVLKKKLLQWIELFCRKQ